MGVVPIFSFRSVVVRALGGLIGVMLFGGSAADAQSTCGNTSLALTTDYQFAVGTSDTAGSYTFSFAGKPLAQGNTPQLALFHYDSSLQSTSGLAPASSVGTSFLPGKWGSALAIATGGVLSYPRAGNLSLTDGTVEMWVSPRYDGTNSVYTQGVNVLFQYTWGTGGPNELALAINNSGSLFVLAGPQAATGNESVVTWRAGDWHHLALTYSTTQGRLRLYADGVLAGEDDTTIQLSATASNFTVNSDAFGHASAFILDELLLSNTEKTAAQIQYDATRGNPFANNEVMLSLSGLSAGQLSYQITPAGSAAPCSAATLTYSGIPITNLNPPSNLLAPEATSVNLSFNTPQATACAYSVGTLSDYGSMKPFATGQGTTSHQGPVTGLSSNPQVLNHVYIRCSSNPDYVQTLEYRSVAALNPPFPRIGSIWWGGYLYATKPNLAAKTALFLSPGFTANQVNSLRAVNPNILVLPGLGSTYTPPLSVAVTPDSYLLKDIHGNPIEIWPSIPPTYLLNMTKPEVAEWAANNLFEQLRQSDFAFDGVFLDTFNLGISFQQYDALGNPIQIDSNGDGVPDNPATLDAAWKAGMLHEIDTLRQLAPYAYISCHCGTDSDTVSRFNGSSLVFRAVDSREGRIPFSSFWDAYNTWSSSAEAPIIVNVEDSPPNQLAYGYGQPIHNMPPALAEFGQAFYPNMRFGLTTALMNDGFFFHDFGDANNAVAWWYDEYDFLLGYPLGPAKLLASPTSTNTLTNGGFESGLAGWTLLVNTPAKAAVAADPSVVAEGTSSAHVAVSSSSTINSDVSFELPGVSVTGGTTYRLQFWARADSARVITINSQGGPPNYPWYGLYAKITIGPGWSLYTASMVAPTTATDGRIQFWVGDVAGSVWIDGVRLSADPPALYRRDFSTGVVLLNGTNGSQTISLEPGLMRFSGSQAPKYQYIVDDTDAGFTSNGSWQTATYDSGVLWDNGAPTSSAEALGPYYHAWQLTAHQLDASSGTAQWNLRISEDGQYTIQAWLPAAPSANTWTKNAIYEVVSAGNVVASASIDQTTASSGDGWHRIATVNLTVADAPFLRVHNGDSASLIADAVYVTSAALYNDGTPAPQVTLAPMDGILLQRQQPVLLPASRVNSVVNAAGFQPAISSAAFVSIVGTGFANSARSWSSSDFSGSNLPLSLDGVSVTINGKPSYVEYISPTQINALAPDDDTVGQVNVEVTTPQGKGYAGTVLKQKLSPAFFAYQAGTTTYVAAVHLDGTLVGPAGPSSRPAAPGEVIEMYGTGFGATTPATPTSQLVSQPAPLVLSAAVSVGGVAAAVQWAGLVSPGLYQLNVKIPNVAAGDQPVQASISGFQSAPNLFVSVASN